MANRFSKFAILASILGVWLFGVFFRYGLVTATDHIAPQGDDLVIVSEKSPETVALHLKEIYPAIRDDLERFLGWKLKSKPVIRLIGNTDVFEKMSGNPHFSAFAIPSEALIVMHISPATSRPVILEEIFKHELCHLLLHDNLRGSSLPKWLDEGVCQWVSGSLGELLSGEGFPHNSVALATHPIPLRTLTYAFPKDRDSLALAYEESRLFVEYLSANYGKQSILAILKHLSEGEGINQAISKTLSKSFESVEEEWLAHSKGWGVWLVWADQHLYDILFFLAAVLTIPAFIFTVLRKRRYHEEEDEE